MILIKHILIIVVTFGIVYAEEPQLAKLNQIYNIELEPKTKKQMKIVIDQQIYNDTQLYISAQTPIDKPFQKSQITVSSDNNFAYLCQYEASNFMDICSIDTKQLTPNREFIISIFCQTKCNLEFAAYLNDAAVIDIGDEGVIGGLTTFGLAQVIQVRVPKGTNFSQIFIQAQILNIQEANEGLTLLVNYGPKNSTQIPSLQNYAMKGQSTWNDGVGVAISKQLLIPSNEIDQIIKCYIYTSENMKVRFFSYIVNGNKFPITINQQFYDFISYNENRIYVLNLTDQLQKIKDQDIDIIVTVFSGEPEIEVAFDQQFNSDKEIKNNEISGKINTLITPSIRQQMGFTGIIYIRISGFWTTTFKVQAKAFSRAFVPLLVQSTEITHLKKDELINFLYADQIFIKDNAQSANKTKKFVVKLQMMDGNVIVGLRRCKQMEIAYDTTCLFTQKEQLKDSSVRENFNEIKTEIEHSYSTYQIRFDYDFGNCHKIVNETTNVTNYRCVFQIVVAQQDNGTLDKADFALTLYKRQFSIRLKEGILVKDTVAENDYHFYVFSLPTLENITSITFFISTIQGDTLLLGSSEDRFPTLFDVENSVKNILFAAQNSLTFAGDLLKKTLYLSVFGFQNSDYTLITMIRRQNKQGQNKTQQLTQISLSEGVMMNYQLQKDQDTLLFAFSPKLNKNIRLTVINLQGTIEYQVLLKDNSGKQQKVPCNSTNSCDFMLSNDKQYYQVKVSGSKESIQKFSIGYNYYEEENCFQYPMNAPLDITLDANQTVCLKYNLKTIRQLQFLISLNSLELFQKNINASLSIKDKKLDIVEHTRTISIQEQQEICSVNHQFEICPIRIEVTSKIKSQFYMILQEVDIQMALFEGISQNIVAKGLNEENGKNFYFEMQPKQGVKILFTKQQANKYRLIARILQVDQYLVSRQSKFPLFNVPEDKTANFIRDINSSVSMLQITSQQLSQNSCKKCMMLISVYRKIQGQQIIDNVISSFNIEISKKQTELKLGEKKNDLVQEGQIHIYSLSLKNQTNNSVLYLSSTHETSCANLMLFEEDGQVKLHRSFIKLNAGKQYKIGVQGKTACDFQLSFFQIKSQIKEITRNLPIDISVSTSNISYFITYHSTNTSFKVIEIIQSGNSNTYIQTIKNSDKLEEILKKNIKQYTFNDGGQFADIQISNTDSKFCKDCYYLIAVKANSNVVEQLIVLDQDKRIPLRENSIFKDRISKQQTKKQYQYHSITTFNISVGIFYGNFTLMVKSPNGSEVVNEAVTGNKQFIIQHPAATDDQYVDAFDGKSQYNISVIYNESNAGYFIQIKKHNVSLRIRQGIPIMTQISNETQTILQFINLQSTTTQNKLTLLLEVIPQNSKSQYKLSDISIAARVQSEKQSQQLPQKIIDSRLESQHSINLQLISVSGTYFLSLKLNYAQPSAKISVILVKQQLTHLIAGKNDLLFNKEAIYEIYNNNQNLMIEIFNCKGEVDIHASSNYSKLIETKNGEGQVVLQHSNFGNHYVISGAQAKGQYFVETFKKQANQDILYKMSYYYYDSSLPYRQLDLARDTIEYNQTETSYIFKLQPILAKRGPQKLQINSIQYNIFIANDQQILQSYSQCLLQENKQDILKGRFIVGNYFQDININNPKIEINNQDIKNIMLNQTNTFFVSAVAEVILSNERENQPSSLKYIYSTSEVIMTKEGSTIIIEPKQTNWKFIVIFIVLPFLVGSLFLMIACRYCIKRIFSSYYPTELIEQEGGPSQENFKNQKGVEK